MGTGLLAYVSNLGLIIDGSNDVEVKLTYVMVSQSLAPETFKMMVEKDSGIFDLDMDKGEN